LSNKSIVERDAELLLGAKVMQQNLLHCDEFFASKNLKVDTMFVCFVRFVVLWAVEPRFALTF